MKIAIIGAGQVGGGFGRDVALNAPSSPQEAKESLDGKLLFVGNITYYDINQANLTEMQAVANEKGLKTVDCVSDKERFKGSLRDADVVIVAVGGDQIGPVTKEFAPYLKPGAIYVETASVKMPVVPVVNEALQQAGRTDVDYIWIHPGTGTAATGPRATAPGIYSGAPVFIDLLEEGASKKRTDAWRTVEWLLKTQNAQIESTTPKKQDEFFAVASGFHHAVVYTLMDVGRNGDGLLRPEYQFAGTTLRNTTRVAGSDPAMLVPLLVGHKENIARINVGFHEQVQELIGAIRRKDFYSLENMLTEARGIRLSLAPKDSIPRESIEGDIYDFRKLSAPEAQSFPRGVLLPAFTGLAETLNTRKALKGIAFERFPNPSFLDGSAPALNDPRSVAQLLIRNGDGFIPVIQGFMDRLDHNVAMIGAGDAQVLNQWTADTRRQRNLMPVPRRSLETQYGEGCVVKSEAVRLGYLIKPDIADNHARVAVANDARFIPHSRAAL